MMKKANFAAGGMRCTSCAIALWSSPACNCSRIIAAAEFGKACPECKDALERAKQIPKTGLECKTNGCF